MTIPEDRLITARDLFDLRFVGDPQVSPDGKQAAFVVTTIDADADEYRSRIWLVTTDASAPPRPLTSGEKADTAPRWSPDGMRIVFLSTRGGKPQLYVVPVDGGEARKVTDAKEGAGEAVWSPDGKRLAFSAAVKAKPDGEKGEGEKDEKAKADEAKEPLRIERLKYKFDGRGYLHGKASIEKWRQIFVVEVPEDPDAPVAEAQQLTSGDWDHDAPAWSPGTPKEGVVRRSPSPPIASRTPTWRRATMSGRSPPPVANRAS